MTSILHEWTLKKGDEIRRVDLKSQYGGSGQGGINPSRKSPNIFIFSDPSTGHQHGYNDHWKDGFFFYVGEGQSGNQEMKRGNRQILEHNLSGRAIRLFWRSSGIVQYGGRFEIAGRDPWHYSDAPQKNGGIRKVIVFRLVEVSE